jgi:predicted dehydrogenase
MLRIGIAGCGSAARIHLDRLLAVGQVDVIGLADPDLNAADVLAGSLSVSGSAAKVATFADHRELLRQRMPDALAIFTPHLAHYRTAMDALQAGCHVFIEKPLSTNVQEAVDIVGLARGRSRKVGVGHQYRLCPSLVEARQRLASGTIGRLRLVTATLAQPWLAAHGGAENAWRYETRASGRGLLADAGDHLLDALLWTTGQTAIETSAVQVRLDSGLDLVTAAVIRLADETPATAALSGVSPGSLFELVYFGEGGTLRATERSLVEAVGEVPGQAIDLPEAAGSIDSNFVAALIQDAPLCCPADQALDTVRLSEAIARSAATGQVVRLA